LNLPWNSGKYVHPSAKGAFPRKHEELLKNLPARCLLVGVLNKDMNPLRTFHSTADYLAEYSTVP